VKEREVRPQEGRVCLEKSGTTGISSSGQSDDSTNCLSRSVFNYHDNGLSKSVDKGGRQQSQRVVLDARHLHKSYGGQVALNDVSVQICSGEVLGIVGENGAGKSTLLGILSGSREADAGEVLITGERLTPATPATARGLGVAIVHQEPVLLPDLSVAENIWLAVPSDRRPSLNGLHEWAALVLKAWNPALSIDTALRPGDLGPEDRWVVVVASALWARPRVLLLDEPTEHLGHENITRLFNAIGKLASEGSAVAYISHRVSEVRAVSHRITVLRDGRSQGTFGTTTVDENTIVRLIVGREVGAIFPPKLSSKAALQSDGIGSSNEASAVVIDEVSLARVHVPSLSLAAGEIVGLAGIDGSGQQEYLRALAGIHQKRRPVVVHFGDKKVNCRSSRKTKAAGIAFVSGQRQTESLFVSLRVGENLVIRHLEEISRGGIVLPWREQRFSEELISRFDIRPEDSTRPIAELSGGNQQKVVLAGILASESRLLLIEELTQGVDVGARAEIYRMLRERSAADGTPCILSSSNAAELAGLCDRVLVFSRGQVVAELSGKVLSEEAITERILQATTERIHTHERRGGVLGILSGDIAPTALVAAAVVVIGLATFADNADFLHAANTSSMLAGVVPLIFVGLAQATVLLVGGIDLSVGPLMGLLVAMESFYWTPHSGGILMALGAILLVVIPAIVGLINWSLVDIIGLHPMVATIVTYIGLEAAGLLVRPQPDGLFSNHIVGVITYSVGIVPISLCIAAVLALGLTWWLFRRGSGIALRAVGSQARNAELQGLRPRRVRLAAYVGCSELAMLGAVALMGQVAYGDPSVGTIYTLSSISVAVVGGLSLLGGRGSYTGVLAGAFLLQEALSITTFVGLSAAWNYYIEGTMILVAVLLYSRTRAVTEAK